MAPRKKRAFEHKLGVIVPAVAQTVQKKENGRRNVRGKRGGLKDMPSMPLDILMEILCLLEPRDLLNLARTSKPFRDLLMNRNSASIWKAARVNVDGFPDCPAHLSEPAYAFLAFFPYCHSCLKPNVQTIHWEFGKRYCRSCLQANTFSSKGWRYDDNHTWALSFSDADIFAKVSVNSRTEVYHRPELDKIKSVRERLRDDPKTWDAYMEEQRARVRAVKDHTALCHAWSQRRAANRSAELQDTREQRLASIVAKLRELGWGEELDRLAAQGYYPLCDNAHVKLSKPLTNRGWLKIKGELVILKRLKLLKSVVIGARSAQPKRTAADECKPRCRDLAMMPEVRRALEVPNDVAVTEQTLQAVVLMLPALEERWQRERRAELVRMLQESGVEAQDGVELLDLAAAVFESKECGQFLHYPHLLMRESTLALYDKAEYQYMNYYRCVYEACGRTHSWAQSSYCVAPKLDRVRALIELCGKDVKVATQSDMDNAGLKLVYDEPVYGAKVMSWRRAIKDMNTYAGFDIGRWRVATDADKAAVKEREDEQRERVQRSNMRHGNYRCAYCGISPVELTSIHSFHVMDIFGAASSKLVHHIKTEHGVEQPTLQRGDYYLYPDGESELAPIRIQERRVYDTFGLGIEYVCDGFDSDDLYGYGDSYDSYDNSEDDEREDFDYFY
ncbi:hypothetical protein FOMPIDRAFT_82129 [Fomitopsis schrenkii]|uniref:F-box domain-containing protein n=1 Tax=Fomitopsis schrenkii TaxID=2126942 RepID=S8EMM7_FOMSC|nr:hypothetical protein FOMPIDRAFT_82129 [Fomitopsis schrenkii]